MRMGFVEADSIDHATKPDKAIAWSLDLRPLRDGGRRRAPRVWNSRQTDPGPIWKGGTDGLKSCWETAKPVTDRFRILRRWIGRR